MARVNSERSFATASRASLFMLIASAATVMATPAGASADTTIIAQNSQLCLKMYYDRKDEGAGLEQYYCTNVSDHFAFTAINGGYSIKNSLSGLCLEYQAGNGAQVVQKVCNTTGAHQTWKFAQQSDMSYTITTADEGKCMDVYGASTAPSEHVQTWDCWGGTNQRFAIAEPPSTTPVSNAAVQYFGRFDYSDPAGPVSKWDTTIFAKFKGTSVSAKFGNNSMFYSASIDGGPYTRFWVAGQGQSVSIATGLTNSDHTIRLVRDNEGLSWHSQFMGFDFGGGELLPADNFADPTRLEVIGDSITCGYGNLQPAPCGYSPNTESAALAYPQVTTQLLGSAPPAVMCHSGIGVVRSYGVDTVSPLEQTMPWEYKWTWQPVDGASEGSLWKFPTQSSQQPTVVVVNLGTNDFWNYQEPTGFVDKYVEFLQTIRKSYPSAHIIAATGPMNNSMETDVQAAVSKFNSSGDARVHYIAFPLLTQGEIGCDWHPLASAHARMASQLAAFIKKLAP